MKYFVFFFQAEDGIRDYKVTGVQTCALPIFAAETLDELVSTHVANGNAATLLTSELDDPTGYGRVVRASDRRVMRIVEQRSEERRVGKECRHRGVTEQSIQQTE